VCPGGIAPGRTNSLSVAYLVSDAPGVSGHSEKCTILHSFGFSGWLGYCLGDPVVFKAGKSKLRVHNPKF